MGLFDGLVGGIVGAEMVTVVNGLIQKHGGMQGVVSQLKANGLSSTVNSWMAEGPNAPVAPSDVHRAFGDQTMSELAAKSGMSEQELAQKLATVLPHAVSAAASDGSVTKS